MAQETPSHDHPAPDPSRRTLLRWATHALGAIFAVILGFPALMYLIDPRNRPPRPTGFRVVEGINIRELRVGEPRQGVIRDIRRDAWTLHPNDVIGRVWVVRYDARYDALHVFTTVCPHLGCSINLATDGGLATNFVCPCHNGQFHLDGSKMAGTNPAPRAMDALVWEIDPENEERLRVRYVNYKQMESTPIERT